MHAIARRADGVEELAFLLEGRLGTAIVAEFEEHVGANVTAQLCPHILVASADVTDAKAA
jgi:hypothetical protein